MNGDRRIYPQILEEALPTEKGATMSMTIRDSSYGKKVERHNAISLPQPRKILTKCKDGLV